jgi:hypothetical protein
MLVSDNAPAHPTIQVEIPFSFGRLGRYHYTQYEATFHNAGRTLYEGGRRIDHPIGDRVWLSAEEGYHSNQFKQPIILFLPYYAYQQHNIRNAIEPTVFNYLANIGLSVQPAGPAGHMRLYGQFLIDDIEAPGNVGQGNRVPRKIGYLVGYAQSFPQTGTDAVLEFAHADRATYSAAHPELAWYSSDLPEGHPVGTNGNEVFVRLGQRFDRRVSGSVEWRDRHRVANDFPAPNVRSLDLSLAYRLDPARSLGLRLSDYREDPFTGASAETPGSFGGAAAGERLRRRIIGLDFLQAF